MPESPVAFFEPLIIALAIILTVTGGTVQLAGVRYPAMGLTGAAVQLAGALTAMTAFLPLHEWPRFAVAVLIAALALRGVVYFGTQVRGCYPGQRDSKTGQSITCQTAMTSRAAQ